MVRPTWRQIQAANANGLYSAANSVKPSVTTTDKTSQSVRSTIDNLDWSGAAHEAAISRADSERKEMLRVSDAFEALQKALSNGAAHLPELITSVRNLGHQVEDNMFSIADDYTVTDDYNYALALVIADGNKATIKQINDLKAKRAREAKEAAADLTRKATALGDEDNAVAQAINSALAELVTAAPQSSLYKGASAKDDLRAMADGKASPEQRARLRDAWTLTDDQKSALANGKPVTLAPGQMEYLKSLSHSLDDMSASEIAKLGEGHDHDSVQRGVADTMRMVSTAGIKDSSGHGGSLDNLPTRVQTLLKEDPVVKTSKDVGTLFNPETKDQFGVSHTSDFNALASILDKGSPGTASGAFVDKGMLRQSTAIAQLADKPYDELTTSSRELNSTASHMLSAASKDHVAVHDVLTGVNMDQTMDGGHFDSNANLKTMLTHEWGSNDQGVKDVLASVGSDAHNGAGFMRDEAGQSASAIAHHIAANQNDYLNIPGQSNDSIGKVNPGITQELSKTLSPYIGSMAQVGDDYTGTSGFTPFTGNKEMSAVFSVIDSNDEAAKYFNHAAFADVQDIDHMVGADPEHHTSMVGNAAHIAYAAQTGIDQTSADHDHDSAAAHAGKARLINLISDTTVGNVPGLGGTASAAIDYNSDDIASSLFGVTQPSDGGPMSTEVHEDALLQRQYYEVFKSGVESGTIDPTNPKLARWVDENGAPVPFEETTGLTARGMNYADFKEDLRDATDLPLSYISNDWEEGSKDDWAR